MKIRLYRGPFNGKVFDSPDAGKKEILISGIKPMTRRQRYDWDREYMKNIATFPATVPRYPRVTAAYAICLDSAMEPLRHPDGSIFYEWTYPRKS